MKYFWINKKNQKQLIVFFNGWGMDENPFVHLDYNNFDLLMLSDYSSLDVDANLINEINSYEKTFVIAWSMGVWAASKVAYNFKKIKKSIAINGTVAPIDDKFGIVQKVYDYTLRTMSEEAKQAFWKNMFIVDDEFERFYKDSPKRSIENQIDELSAIKKLCQKNEKTLFEFDCAIISKGDKIFRTKSQKNFWSQYLEPVFIEAGHFPFYCWKDWDDIINAAK